MGSGSQLPKILYRVPDDEFWHELNGIVAVVVFINSFHALDQSPYRQNSDSLDGLLHPRD